MKPATTIGIIPARPADEPAIAGLLRAAGLPHADFAPHLPAFLVAVADGVVVGAIGAERADGDALLRSLVVAPAWRGAGLGGRLVAALEAQAPAWGVRRWWLLTTDAADFFLARGYSVAERAAAPPAIAATGQFRGLCPSAAVCLTRAEKAAS